MPKLGFTLVEVIIVIALFSVVVAFSFPFIKSYNTQQMLDGTSDELFSLLRRAQSKAMSGDNGTQWGIHWGTGEYIIFSGDNYDERDQEFDLIIDYHDAITVSPSIVGSAPYPTDIIFNELTGETDTIGTISVSDATGSIINLTISSRGQIARQ